MHTPHSYSSVARKVKGEHVGVILANTGSPDAPTAQAISQYLGQFLLDPCIAPTVPKPIWRTVVERCIIPKRSLRSAQRYQHIWTEAGSPLCVTMDSLSEKLEAALADANIPIRVQTGMSYGHPSLSQAIATLTEQGCTRVLVQPLYPQAAYSTTGAVHGGINRLQQDKSSSMTLLDGYSEEDAYIKALSEQVQTAGFDKLAGDFLLISYHSIPRVDIRNGDTYAETTTRTSYALAEQLGLSPQQWTQSYQCRFDKARSWLSPFTKATIDHLAANPPAGRLFVICPNFAIDCLETLYDVEYELQERYLSRSGRPAKDFCYIPCLNDSSAQVELLAKVIKAAL